MGNPHDRVRNVRVFSVLQHCSKRGRACSTNTPINVSAPWNTLNPSKEQAETKTPILPANTPAALARMRHIHSAMRVWPIKRHATKAKDREHDAIAVGAMTCRPPLPYETPPAPVIDHRMTYPTLHSTACTDDKLYSTSIFFNTLCL